MAAPEREASASEDEADAAAQATSAAPGPGSSAAEEKPRSAEAVEKEKRLTDNYDKYERMSDEELQAVVPKKEDGSFTSIGAIMHAAGNCSACNFFHFALKGCNLGIRCKFCHDLHEKKERKRKNTRKRARDKKDAADSGDYADVQQCHADSRNDTRGANKRRVSSELHFDDYLGIYLDVKGNSRPSWAESEERGQGGPLPGHTLPPGAPGGFQGHPGYPPPAALMGFPPAGYPPGGFPPALATGYPPGGFPPAGYPPMAAPGIMPVAAPGGFAAAAGYLAYPPVAPGGFPAYPPAA